MPHWSIHLPHLAPDEALGPLIDDIEWAIDTVERRVATVAQPFTLDIFVQCSDGNVIPELGYVGYSPGPGAIYLTFDPANANLRRSLGAPLGRMIAHECHHAMRWREVGYGRTLLEALVSEGLAGHFVRELYQSEPEPWERALPASALAPFAAEALRDGDALTYDHAA